MGNIIKINTYAEKKRSSYKIINIKTLEENLVDYSNWLRTTNREDKIENYERFLQAQ